MRLHCYLYTSNCCGDKEIILQSAYSALRKKEETNDGNKNRMFWLPSDHVSACCRRTDRMLELDGPGLLQCGVSAHAQSYRTQLHVRSECQT